MKVEHITNAAVIFHLSSGETILADPWLRSAAFYGSWYNFPPLSADEIERYESFAPSSIYISHTHEDHLHPPTLARYPKDTPILIGKLPHNHLRRAVERLGFRDIRELPFGETTSVGSADVTILADFGLSGDGFPDDTGYAIDSSIHVRDVDGTSVLHVVDNPMQIADAEAIRARFGSPDVALVPYSGASIFPHAFFAYSHEEKLAKAEAIKQSRLALFQRLSEVLEPAYCVPAAGSYVLGGRIAPWSAYLNQATPDEVEACFSELDLPGCALCLLATGDVLDAKTGEIARHPDAGWRRYTEDERTRYAVEALGQEPMAQDQVAIPAEFAIPWRRLLEKARANQRRMQQKLGAYPATDVELVVLGTPGVDIGGEESIRFPFALDEDAPEPKSAERMRVVFRIEASLLLMVLVGAAIWNNIEAACLVECAREPDRHDPTVHSLMSYFAL